MADNVKRRASDSLTAKPGIKTSEFWLSLLTTVLLSLTSLYAEEEWAKVAGILGASLVAMGYGLSRGAAKK